MLNRVLFSSTDEIKPLPFDLGPLIRIKIKSGHPLIGCTEIFGAIVYVLLSQSPKNRRASFRFEKIEKIVARQIKYFSDVKVIIKFCVNNIRTLEFSSYWYLQEHKKDPHMMPESRSPDGQCVQVDDSLDLSFVLIPIHLFIV